jgi:hypothetical protein
VRVILGGVVLNIKRLVLLTVDGVRWQEVFSGLDPQLLEAKSYTTDEKGLRQKFWHDSHKHRRSRLMPFFWNTIEKEGAFIGDRQLDSEMEVSNAFWFSFPCYNEMLTGAPDPQIASNTPGPNPNISVLELINSHAAYRDKVWVYAAWDAFSEILNVERSGLKVSTGPLSETLETLTPEQRLLDRVERCTSPLWPSVRQDVHVHMQLMDRISAGNWRVLYAAYGATDDFGHDGSYDRYVHAINFFDNYVAEVWDAVNDGNTTLLLTTDHGRGYDPIDSWRDHMSGMFGQGTIAVQPNELTIAGSQHIWFAALGPDIPPKGLVRGNFTQAQVAATISDFLNIDMPMKVHTMAPSLAPQLRGEIKQIGKLN